MEKQLGPNTKIFIDGGLIQGVELKGHATLLPQIMTKVEKSLLDSLAGLKPWDAPLDKEIAADAARLLDRRMTMPITRLERDVLGAILEFYLAGNAASLSKLLKQVSNKRGIETAIQTLADVDTFKSMQREFSTTVSAGESGTYWMEDMVAKDIETLYQKKPVVICDFGASTGSIAHRMRQELGPKVFMHATDLGYGPHRPLDMLYRTATEAPLKSMKEAFDISMSVYSTRYSPLPHLAVRNMLRSTRHAAYMTFEDNSGVNSALLALQQPTRDLYYAYMGGRQNHPLSLNALQPSINAKIRNELSKAQERGFTITAATKGQDAGETFLLLDLIPEDRQLHKIIAKKM